MPLQRLAMLMAAALLFANGCATAPPPEAQLPANAPESREGLERLPDTELDFLFVEPGFRLANYDRYYVEPLAIVVPTGTIGAADQQRMRELFAQVLDEVLDPEGPLERLSNPEPGALVVRPQVLDLRQVPEGFELPESRFAFRMQQGRMTLVAEIVESGRDEVVLARAADLERSASALPTEVGDWAVVDLAFRRWVLRFRERMQASEATAR